MTHRSVAYECNLCGLKTETGDGMRGIEWTWVEGKEQIVTADYSRVEHHICDGCWQQIIDAEDRHRALERMQEL